METKQISSSLREARFILVRKGIKDPAVSKGVDWNTQTIGYEEANVKLQEGYNIGLVCGLNEIICIDCDKLELAQACEGLLPKTYSEQTTSGGHHYFYKVKGEYENLEIKQGKEHFGEIRSHRQFVVIAPSIAKNKQGKMNSYKVLSENEIPYIEQEQVKSLVLQFMDSKDTSIKAGKIPQELLNRINQDQELKTLFETELLKGERSEKEQELVGKLVSRDFTKDEIFQIMGASMIGKWNERPISYRDMTYNKSVQYVTNQKKEYIKTEVKPLHVMTIRDYENYKVNKNYIIQDVLEPKESGMLYAPSGSFKSLLALYQAVCIASGKKYLGKFKVKKQAVLILSAENRIETDKKRIKEIMRGMRLRKKDIPLYILPRNECQDILYPEFQAQIENFITEKNIKVLYLDTINPLTPEVDDNKAKDVTIVFNSFIKPLCDNFNCSVVFLHHTGKDENNYLGSIKWRANVDKVWRIDRNKLSQTFKIYNEKGRDGEASVKEVKIEFSDDKIEFSFMGTEQAQVFSKKKKMSQAEFFKLKLNELIQDKKTDRAKIQAIFIQHKIKFSRATLDRAIQEWRK